MSDTDTKFGKSQATIGVSEITSNSDDIEANEANVNELEAHVEDVGYKRQITGRQVLMITFGAGIGTGFWIGMGSALRNGGPFGIVFAYFIESLIVYIMFIQVGEMTTYQPIHGGFINQIRLYVDDATAFAQGVSFAFNWMVCLAAELTAGISVLKMWDTEGVVSTAEYIVIFFVIYVVCNIWPVKAYGYIEYVQSFFKIVSMAGATLFMFISTCGGLPNSDGPIGYKYWKNPGWIRNGIKDVHNLSSGDSVSSS
ncbi:unnamed protein product [Ambrosiozyma monospora]|uniref:Unnamed protein product n=1 Tax=Ambrosiozyma monospora TaxID=43982 RepID=A0ACB5T2M5_AMBMO|nr:unnamed protein product [Ambrosiozyma monospora]